MPCPIIGTSTSQTRSTPPATPGLRHSSCIPQPCISQAKCLHLASISHEPSPRTSMAPCRTKQPPPSTTIPLFWVAPPSQHLQRTFHPHQGCRSTKHHISPPLKHPQLPTSLHATLHHHHHLDTAPCTPCAATKGTLESSQAPTPPQSCTL